LIATTGDGQRHVDAFVSQYVYHSDDGSDAGSKSSSGAAFPLRLAVEMLKFRLALALCSKLRE